MADQHCPYCRQTTDCYLKGTDARGQQRYLCKTCGKHFTSGLGRFEPEWTMDDALACGEAFVRREGRRPRELDLRDDTMPSDTVIVRLFGSISAFQARLPAPPAPKQRACLLCSRVFVSQHAGHRVCDACKKTDEWLEPAEGLDGSVITWKCPQGVL